MKREELTDRIGLISLMLNVLLTLVQFVCTIVSNNIIVFWVILVINTIAAMAFAITNIIEKDEKNKVLRVILYALGMDMMLTILAFIAYGIKMIFAAMI